MWGKASHRENTLFSRRRTHSPMLEQLGEEREPNQEQEQTNTTMKDAITKSVRKQTGLQLSHSINVLLPQHFPVSMWVLCPPRAGGSLKSHLRLSCCSAHSVPSVTGQQPSREEPRIPKQPKSIPPKTLACIS